MIDKNLNEEQKEAVDHTTGPLLVLAGAGSGKTRVVTNRIVKLLQVGVPTSDILAVTFTNKAADEMTKRVKAISYQNVLISTFHSLGVRILRETIQHLGYSNNFTIYDEEDSLKLLKQCSQSLNIKEEKSFLKSLKYKISSLKNDLLDFDDPNSFFTLTDTEKNIALLYQENLKKCQSVDFDDLLYLPIKIFNKENEVLSIYQKKWSFILIDEYQDTNFAQSLLTKLLSMKHQNIMAVGDPDQSIYSFRGAKYQNILNFEKDYPGSRVIKLEKNYRSSETILNASNDLIKNNFTRLEKKLISTKDQGEKIKTFIASNDQTEAEYIVEKLIRHHVVEKYSYDDMAIFYRTNFQSRAFEDLLLEKKIPYVIYGGISFYQRKEIKDIIAFLRLIISDSDFLSFSRTINIAKKGFGKTTLNKLFFYSEQFNIPVMNALKTLCEDDCDNQEVKLSSKQKESLQSYLSSFYSLKDIYQTLSLKDLIEEVIETFNYYNYLKEEDINTFEDRKENVDQLILKAKEHNKSLQEFLEELALISSVNKPNINESHLKLMTLHNSKGLEFDLVFIAGLEEDLLPHINSKNNLDEIEEERRLFYVGMTRAKKQLYLTLAQQRFMFGSTRFSIPSRFLKEIPGKYLKSASIYTSDVEDIEEAEFYVGQRVNHNTFGFGVIQKIYSSSFGETFDILFDDNTSRSIASKYAKLTICRFSSFL